MRTITTICVLLAAMTAYAGDEPAPKQGPAPAALDATFQQINKEVLDSYVGTLPPNWNSWTPRFSGKLDVNGNLKVATDIMLSSAKDNRLRLLSPKEIEAARCRPVSGFVGLGVMFRFTTTIDKGFEIAEVLDGSPAKAANLQSHTTIVAVNGQRLAGADLIDASQLLFGAGTEIKLTVLDGEKESDVTVAKRNKEDKLGIAFNYGKTSMTVAVGRVFPNSPAEKAGLRVGELITKINGNVVKTADADWFMSQSGQTAYDRLGDTIGLTVVRDNAEVNLELQRSIVVDESRAFSLSVHDRNDQRLESFTELTLANLDWTKIVDSLDKNVSAINQRTSCTIDLCKASGDNPELSARLAARFIQDGDLLAYSEKQGGKTKTTRFFVAQRDGKTTLLSECEGVEKVIEQVPQAVTSKLTVLVGEFTSGTAEALASALQRSGRATIRGAETADRADLTEAKTFTSGDCQIVVEVPVKRLVLSAGQKTLAVKPVASTLSITASLFIGLGVAIFLIALCSTCRMRRTRHVVVVVLAVAAGFACICYGLQKSANAPKTEAQKASAFISNILWTDEDSRIDRLRYAQQERGKLDVQLKFGEKPSPVADAEIKTASRIAEAIAEGDFEAVRKIIASYAYKPYARAQIAGCLNHAFHKAGVDIYILSHNGSFYLERNGLEDGQVMVNFTPLDPPAVTVMVNSDPERKSSFSSTENPQGFEAQEVFATFRAALVRAVQDNRAKGN